MIRKEIGSSIYPNIGSEEYEALKSFCSSRGIELVFTERDTIEVGVSENDYNLLENPADLVIQEAKSLCTIMLVWIGLSDVTFTDGNNNVLCKFSII